MKSLDKENILYCDNHLLVVEKSPGMATQPDLVDCAKIWVKKEFHKVGNVFLEPVHRIDKPVSGLILFARTSKALSRLQQMMRDRTIHKIYLALLEGELQQEGTLKHRLVHDEYRARVAPEGKEAILHYHVCHRKGELTLVEVRLETGRYHQIRAQFAAIKCPIVGDKKYGSRKDFPEGIALHHYRMEFKHPVTQSDMRLEASTSRVSLPI